MSLLDTPQKRLNPFIFDENERARPEFRDYILSSIAKFMPPETVKHVLLLGSMAGRQYSDTSDIDINVTTDTEGHVTDANGTISTRNLTKSDIGLSNVPNTNIAYSSTIPADNFTSIEVSNLRAGKLDDGTTPWTSNNYYDDSDAVLAVSTADDYVKNTGDTITGNLNIDNSRLYFTHSGQNDWSIHADGEDFSIREQEDGDKEYFRIEDDASIYIKPAGNLSMEIKSGGDIDIPSGKVISNSGFETGNFRIEYNSETESLDYHFL